MAVADQPRNKRGTVTLMGEVDIEKKENDQKQGTDAWWWPEGVIFRGKRTSDIPIYIKESRPQGLLSKYIQCFWDMRWELGLEQTTCLVVPSGCVNVVYSLGRLPPGFLKAKIVGARTVSHPVEMTGSGISFGFRFSPGGFYAFSKKDASSFTDKVFPLDEVFGEDAAEIESIGLKDDSVEKKAANLKNILARHIPHTHDEDMLRLHKIMQAISENEKIKNTAQLTSEFGITERSLQRLFSRYVGVSPTMWIRTKRFQQAAKQVLAGNIHDWSRLATELGYYDQSHFINDFRSLTGRKPSELVTEREILSDFSNTRNHIT